MKKRNKIIILVIIVICLLAGTFALCHFFIEKKLAGEKITDGVYVYNLDAGENYHEVIVIDNNIYYFSTLDKKYELYKIDIYKNEKELVGAIELDNYYCYIENEHIICSGEDNEKIYNFKLEKVYDGRIEKVIPYKDNFIKIINNIIYFKDKEYRIINKDINNYNLYQYDVLDNNIYLYYGNYDGESFIYNVEEDKYEDYKYDGIKKYINGLFYFDEDEIHVINSNTKEEKTYDNPLDNGSLYSSELDRNLLYYFSNDYLKIYNLDNNKVNFFDYRINKSIYDIVINNNLVFLTNEEEVYVIALDEITTKEMTLDELDELLEKRISDKIEKIKGDYAVEVKIRDDANLKFDMWKQSTTGEEIYDVINDALDNIEEILKKFGKEFFDEFIHDEYTGVRIYLVSMIEADDFSRNGEAFRYYDKYTIIAQSYDIKRTLCHELMHTLEDAVFAKGKDMFSEWTSYNPDNFSYKINYNPYDSTYKYTIEYGKGDIYFVDNYSLTNGLEDRARVFENVCMNTTEDIKKYPNLLKKAEYEKEEILKFYPMLKESDIFDSLN